MSKDFIRAHKLFMANASVSSAGGKRMSRTSNISSVDVRPQKAVVLRAIYDHSRIGLVEWRMAFFIR